MGAPNPKSEEGPQLSKVKIAVIGVGTEPNPPGITTTQHDLRQQVRQVCLQSRL